MLWKNRQNQKTEKIGKIKKDVPARASGVKMRNRLKICDRFGTDFGTEKFSVPQGTDRYSVPILFLIFPVWNRLGTEY